MNYTLHQLKVFLKIVYFQSITKASEELHLTQPAVSIQLKNFQDQFDIPLTEVIGRRIYITDFGHEIAKSAQKILIEAEEIKNKTMAYKGNLTGKLKLSVVSTGKYIMPYFLTEFLEQYQGVNLTMDVTNKKNVVESLAANDTDFALVSILPDGLKFDKINLLRNKLYLVGSSKNRESAKILNHEQLSNLNYIFREYGSGTRQSMENFFEKNGIQITNKLELTSNEAVKQAILAGLGYSIMPLIGIKSELQNKELKIIPAKGLPIETNWSLIWLKDKKHSPTAAAYLDFVNSQKSKIINEKFSWYEQY
jgi:DNA-binding transcriptional LysR family regulator